MTYVTSESSQKTALRKPIPLAERKRFVGKPIPAEGEDGLFSQSWFPVCLSTEVPVGTIIGRDFLDGRVIVYRGQDGVARIQSAYCPHLGADLWVGKLVGDRVQCTFHPQ